MSLLAGVKRSLTTGRWTPSGRLIKAQRVYRKSARETREILGLGPTAIDDADVVKVVENYAAWLAESHVPKLFINADPGSILVGRQREICRAWPNQTEVTVKGRHFVQEDSPDEIGQAVADFVRRVRSQ